MKHRVWLIAALVTLLPMFAGTARANYFNGFETDLSGWTHWSGFGAQYVPTRVASGTHGIASKTGAWHAEAGQFDLDNNGGSASTDWGGYSATFPPAGWSTSVDIYLDCAYAGTAGDKRIDWDSAVNDNTGSFRRDFVFNLGTEATGFVISTSNNAGRSGAYPPDPGHDPIHITTTGWYTFKHTFTNVGGVLSCRFEIFDPLNNLVHSWTRSDPSDMIPSVVGGNRYGWFAAQELPFLAFDNSRLDLAIPPDNVAAQPAPGTCISNAHPCVNVPVVFNRVDATNARGITVTIQLSSNLQLCDPAHPGNSIHQGSWISGFGNHYEVVDNGGGSYTVDQAILGLPCGQTSGGTLFTLDLAKVPSATDGTGTISVTSVSARDCDNNTIPGAPGADGTVTIDYTAPTAIADLGALQQKTGNPAGQTTNVKLTWTATEAGSSVAIYRKGFGGYPDYDDAGGVVPTTPATPAAATGAGWTLAGTVAAPTATLTDLTGARDFYYYVAFITDGCGNVSAVSNQTSGTLNYHLGDVSDGFTACNGDNQVNTADISLLGAHYATTNAVGGPFECLDVGPTTNNSVNGRPTTDHKVNFEDLILFAINYGTVSAPQMAAAPVAQAQDEVWVEAPASVVAGQTFTALVKMKGAGVVQGLSTQLGWDESVAEAEGVEAGDLMTSQNGVVFSAGHGNADAALLGVRAQGIAGEGVLAKVTFRALLSGKPAVTLASVDLRDAANRKLTPAAGVGSAPKETALMPVRPNPAPGRATVSFALSHAGPVELALYGVDGRRVRDLVHESREPGVYQLTWDGRDNAGQMSRPGLYFVRLQTPQGRFTRTIALVK